MSSAFAVMFDPRVLTGVGAIVFLCFIVWAARQGALILMAERPARATTALAASLALSFYVPVAWAGGGGSSGPNHRWVISNLIGTGMVLLDQDGERLRHRVLTPFGKEHDSLGSASQVSQYYAGHRRHEGSGLVYMNARWQDPEAGVFMTVDPLVSSKGDPQSYNAFSYVRNNPVNSDDPSGEMCRICLPGGASSGDPLPGDAGYRGTITTEVKVSGLTMQDGKFSTYEGTETVETTFEGRGEVTTTVSPGEVTTTVPQGGATPEIVEAGIEGARMIEKALQDSGETGLDSIRERSVGGTTGNLRQPAVSPSGKPDYAPGPQEGDSVHVHVHLPRSYASASPGDFSGTPTAFNPNYHGDMAAMRQYPGLHSFLILENGSLVMRSTIQVAPGAPIRVGALRQVLPAGSFSFPSGK